MAELIEVAAQLRAARPAIREAEAQTLAHWAFAAAKNVKQALATGQQPGGGALAPNTPYTAQMKARRGLDRRVGVREGSLLAGLGTARAITILDARRAEVYGSDGAGNNDLKATLLIKGARHKKRGKTFRQPPRDFVGHDETTVEKACERALDEVTKALGW